MAAHDLDRREFLGGTAGALLVLGFPFGKGASAAAGGATGLNAWLTVADDSTVTILCPSAEMGQGVYSTLPAIIAEELSIPWDRVRVAMAPAGKAFANSLTHLQATFDSTSVRGHFAQLRLAGATAREMLRQAAVLRWQVRPDECSAQDGVIVHRPTGRQASYGSLAADAARLPPPPSPPLKPRSEWRLLGTRLPRKDTAAKVEGTAVFGIDVAVPGMLVGTVAACPVAGGKLRGVDPTPALELPDVRNIVPLDNAVIVLARHYWAARKGLLALEPQWDLGPNAALDDATIGGMLTAAVSRRGLTAAAEGDVEAALRGSDGKLVTATYEVPYLAHATMEPMNATAHVRAAEVEIWAPTQSPELNRMAVARALSIDPERIIIHSTFLGGGFGRRSENDFVLQAVAASKASGAPVKLIWSREEDMRHDFYRPRAIARFAGKVKADGRIAAWNAHYSCQSVMARLQPHVVTGGIDEGAVEGAIRLPYRFDAHRTEFTLLRTGLPVGFWRSPGHNQNAFFTESYIDELAHAAGKDPVAFRLALLGDKPRHRAVLERAAAMIGWGKPALAGIHRGIALHESHGSIVAEGVELSWRKGRRIEVRRMSCAIDCGLALNPDTIEAQMESGIVYGLTAAVFGEINVAAGSVLQSNFRDYAMLHLRHMPAIDVAIIESGADIGGIGEPSTPPVAPALAGAIFAATGERIRSLPLSRHGIRAD